MKITDIHTHGIGGYDTRTATEEDILKIAEIQGAHGVDGVVLAVYPSAIGEMRMQMETIKKAMLVQQSSPDMHRGGRRNQADNQYVYSLPASQESGPARIAGIHLEGPFLNPSQAGSLRPGTFVEPSEYLFRELTEGFEDIVKIITIAPEIPGALPLIRHMADTGVTVSMGHSDATYVEAEMGFHAGAKGITHTFNAMRGFHHREPGIAGFGILNRNIYVEVIADPFHLHNGVIELIFRMKNPEKIIIVSDTVKETGRAISHSGVRNDSGKLLGGSMAVTESAERLIRKGYDRGLIFSCITDNPQAYLSGLL